ncbi:MAG: leucyl/phenylalanyl-tRNA--protein transferase [Comamonas sp.]
MKSPARIPPLPWLQPGDEFPAPETAWGPDAPLPGLLAAGGELDAASLERAYRHGIFPWFSPGDPTLWWSPDPRMVLQAGQFRLHRSLRKTLERFRTQPGCEIRIDSAFDRVIRHCAATPRQGQAGTWIVPDVIAAYGGLHRAGHAHSVETWIDGQLAGGLYLVNLGRAVFGESMFAHHTDASKIALAALVAFARAHGIRMIDCQQNTRHLASLGAAEIARATFLGHVRQVIDEPAPRWQFSPVYWNQLLPPAPCA